MTILRECAVLLEEKKGENIAILDLRGVNSYLDYFLIVTGNSHVHCRSLARGVMKLMASRNRSARNKADLNSGWIILDFDEIIIHIFTEDLRGFYQLEKLWSDAVTIGG
ncbi:MAG: ribosome silencing factor [Spirochaetes bacterium]|nr:ribosome silencing factor [Spirochaetota bacterium]